MATYQVRINSDGEKALSEPLSGLEGGIATEEAPGVVRPDGATTRVDNTGLLSAIGGNLLLNDELWLTESGSFTARVTGWHELVLYDGGQAGAVSASFKMATGGASGKMKHAFVYLETGQEVPVTVGAGGIPASAPDGTNAVTPGATSFGDLTTAGGVAWPINYGPNFFTVSGFYASQICGSGLDAGAGAPLPVGLTQAQYNANCSARGHYGGGGGASYGIDGSGGFRWGAGNGAQGSVWVRWHDPAKAAGPIE